MERNEILHWLREDNPEQLELLWQQADRARRVHVGDAVHLRGLIEISNHCVRRCGYCGLRIHNRDVRRYRMTHDEIIRSAREALRRGYGTVVLQSGEDPGLHVDWVSELILRIKRETSLAVTLSLGERTREELTAWREAGADRYLLRFETSDRKLYDRIHPRDWERNLHRMELLETIKALGYETGSGVMVGIPGQKIEMLANDLEWFKRLDLDMIGIGPYIPHPRTPLGQDEGRLRKETVDQVANNEVMTCKVIALARLLCPDTNIPSTTALETLNRRKGLELGLRRGANVVMPNLTPAEYRHSYEIYPGKATSGEDPEIGARGVTLRIGAIGRILGYGRGDSPNYAGDMQYSIVPEMELAAEVESVR